MMNLQLKYVIEEYKKWKAKHPHQGYQYDQIFDFLEIFSRGEILELLENLESEYDQEEKDTR